MQECEPKKDTLAEQRTDVIREIGKYRGRIRKWEQFRKGAKINKDKKQKIIIKQISGEFQ
jgi:hypothetical protein